MKHGPHKPAGRAKHHRRYVEVAVAIDGATPVSNGALPFAKHAFRRRRVRCQKIGRLAGAS